MSGGAFYVWIFVSRCPVELFSFGFLFTGRAEDLFPFGFFVTGRSVGLFPFGFLFTGCSVELFPFEFLFAESAVEHRTFLLANFWHPIPNFSFLTTKKFPHQNELFKFHQNDFACTVQTVQRSPPQQKRLSVKTPSKWMISSQLTIPHYTFLISNY